MKIKCNQKVKVETLRFGKAQFGFGLISIKKYRNAEKNTKPYSNRVKFSLGLLLKQIDLLFDWNTFFVYAAQRGAIALDGAVIEAPQDTATQAMTVNTGSNRLLITSFASYQGGEQPSGVVFNTTETVTSIVQKTGSYSECSSIWGLIAPTQTTANVVYSDVGAYYVFAIYSLTGCDQTVLPATTATGGAESSTASLSITPTVDNCWIIDALEAEPVPTMTTTDGVNDWVDEGQSYQHGAGSHFVQTTAAAKTMSYSLSYGARWNLCACAVKPAAAAAASTPLRMLMGMGV